MIPDDLAGAIESLLHMGCGALITWLGGKIWRKRRATLP